MFVRLFFFPFVNAIRVRKERARKVFLAAASTGTSRSSESAEFRRVGFTSILIEMFSRQADASVAGGKGETKLVRSFKSLALSSIAEYRGFLQFTLSQCSMSLRLAQLIFAALPAALAWGGDGHAVVAQLSQERIKDETQEAIDAIMGEGVPMYNYS
ncbi:hypothetical protein FOZ60_001533 [Perkinsus olseni]|uniref:Uncharacterized protein n=1 Tax=Perkinsus olseni TaxID=32597 RepID=A0A7J6P067_PEROL|nr:hypothetical protein FOZ60_001533 [Perkinsus olseni]